jgi:glycogen operon protein
MDSLRYWVEVMHVDGFRFDLASTLARTGGLFNRDGPFCRAIRQDPVLNKVKLIAEPWDIGHDGYQLGAYPAPFCEWNDKYRDNVRGFWRGDDGMARKLSRRISGSAIHFDHDGRPATSSINFLTAHDGFTLMDTVSYNKKNNLANGEDNRDGHDHNFSDNCGVEGPTDDPAINARRAQRRRNMFATLLLSQGVPMILAGDELGNSQSGNNNAYAQDNPMGWVDWDNADGAFLQFCRSAIAFRKDNPILRQKRFLHARPRPEDGKPDIFWRKPDGRTLRDDDWNRADLRFLGVEMRMAHSTPTYERRFDAIYLVFNGGADVKVTMPEAPEGQYWRRVFDTSQPDESHPPQITSLVRGNSVAVFKMTTDAPVRANRRRKDQ